MGSEGEVSLDFYAQLLTYCHPSIPSFMSTSPNRCGLSRDFLVCFSGKNLHYIRFSQTDVKPATLPLSQNIAQLQPVKSLDKPAVSVDFESTGTVKSSQVVIFNEQSNVACKPLSSSAQWVINDSSQKSYTILQFTVKNDVSK